MKIWLPYIQGGSGSDVFTETLARELLAKGLDVTVSRFPHHLQYFPWLLKRQAPPAGTEVILANSWNAFVFERPGAVLVAVEHLLVLDPALAPFRSRAQALFHNIFVRYFERATGRAADRLVAVSEYTARTYRAALGDSPTVILNGIDTGFFTPLASDDSPVGERPFRLLFVGNMGRRKGADMLPLIMQRLGEGYELSYTAGIRASDPFPDLGGVRRLGKLDHEGVRAEYRRADLMLFPTRLEGLPLVAMEAMACGTPVIASDTASLPEVIRPGESGELCRLDDPSAFAEAIQHLRDDPDALRAMSERAVQEARSRFSLDRMSDEYVALFRELLSAAGRQGNNA